MTKKCSSQKGETKGGKIIKYNKTKETECFNGRGNR